MHRFFGLTLCGLFLLSCSTDTPPRTASSAPESPALTGTWQLLSGTVIENGDTTVTDYTEGVSFIKIINATHFAFLQHAVGEHADSAAAFVAGGGRYTLADSTYTEHLDYCSAPEWEGNDFTFTVSLRGDTLVQQGREEVASAGISRLNIEKYRRVH
ncbi:Lipocalin-like domain-containing protein [Catalinimonas alkaloidigena]|uniref:Lipocalin-like domain-containing protein n=1 Tax=Catalinimonas alkaloidigena TaxID=1075417 RepID=A0A1G9SCL1_9BACT|nr:lipocalin-like domain-containing protein [Catalinimonas alkaloidigena]SDM33204.1 Lipocalin-like domain-containing protein [Catalinimonas alkaloidigena]